MYVIKNIILNVDTRHPRCYTLNKSLSNFISCIYFTSVHRLHSFVCIPGGVLLPTVFSYQFQYGGIPSICHTNIFNKIIDAQKCPPFLQVMLDQPKEVVVPPTSCVPIFAPSTAFGHAVFNVDKNSLIREYSKLWYEEPENLKQRASNKFVLDMCTGARNYLQDKYKTIEWGRKERNIRVLMMLTFALKEDIQKETKYFKKECISHNLEAILQQNKEAYSALTKCEQGKGVDMSPAVT